MISLFRYTNLIKEKYFKGFAVIFVAHLVGSKNIMTDFLEFSFAEKTKSLIFFLITIMHYVF